MLTKKSIELYPVLLPFTNSYIYKFIAIENLLMILISYIIFLLPTTRCADLFTMMHSEINSINTWMCVEKRKKRQKERRRRQRERGSEIDFSVLFRPTAKEKDSWLQTRAENCSASPCQVSGIHVWLAVCNRVQKSESRTLYLISYSQEYSSLWWCIWTIVGKKKQRWGRE